MVAVSSKVKGLLLEEGLVSEDAWAAAVGGEGDPIEALMNQGELHEPALMEVLGRAAGIPPVDLRRVQFDIQTSTTYGFSNGRISEAIGARGGAVPAARAGCGAGILK